MLAHLVADFVLQPYELVKLKNRPVGLVIHAAVHGVITAVLAASFLPRWWLALPLLVLAHYALDWLKVARGPSSGPISLAVFLGDQAAHLVVLALVVLAAGLPLDAQIVSAPEAAAVLYYAIPYLAVTVAGAILIYHVALAFSTRPDPGGVLAWPARLAGMVERALALTVVLFLPPALWPAGLLPVLILTCPARGGRGRWIEAAWHLGLALVLGVLFRHRGAV